MILTNLVLKDCLTTSSLGRNLMMSLCHDDTFYTWNHQYIRQFIKEARYGGRIGATTQKVNLSLCTENKTI